MNDKTFMDTSALFKRYIKEKNYDIVDKPFEESDVIASNMSIVELMSNLKRLESVSGGLNTEVYNTIKNEFFHDIAAEKIIIHNITNKTIIDAVENIDKKYITPINSLQLAAAMELNNQYSNLVFVSGDIKKSACRRKRFKSN